MSRLPVFFPPLHQRSVLPHAEFVPGDALQAAHRAKVGQSVWKVDLPPSSPRV